MMMMMMMMMMINLSVTLTYFRIYRTISIYIYIYIGKQSSRIQIYQRQVRLCRMVCVVCRLSLLAFCVYFSHVCHPIRNSWYHQYDSKMGTAYIPVYTGYLYIWKHTGEWPILSFIAINRNPLMTIFMENVTWYSSHHCYNYETVPSMKCVFRSIWREINK